MKQDLFTRLSNGLVADYRSDCFLWVKNKDKDGYGKIFWANKHWRVHRLMFFLSTGVDPTNKLICHKCDNPSCANPKHLFAGTPLSNMQDKVEKGRLRNQHMDKTHCKNGHKFTKKNTRFTKDMKRRTCEICRKAGVKNRNLLRKPVKK